MKVEIWMNKRSETVMPFHIFKRMPRENVLKAIKDKRKKRSDLMFHWDYDQWQKYWGWFGQKYLADKQAADFGYEYNEHYPTAEFILNNVDYDLEARVEFWTTLDDILAWPVTLDCPEIEIGEDNG